ncbi:hypothetical protein HY837_06930 [archaeon]|nr:hypothetical protein [archaeon]
MGFFGALKDLFKYTKAEVYLAAIIGLGIGGTCSYKYENSRNNKLPLMFSEKTQIHKDATEGGQQIGPSTEYLTSTNDACMKVFECWNQAMARDFSGDRDKKFAEGLKIKMDSANKEHNYSLDELLNGLPQEANLVLASIPNFVEARDRAKNSAYHFDNSWTESHIDHYRTVTKTRTVSDGNGKSHTETYTEQEYDHTTHTYDYHPEAGDLADDTLRLLLQAFPEIIFKEKIPGPSKTNTEGQLAMDKSIEHEEGKTFTKADYLTFATKWNTGSTLLQNLGVIRGAWAALPGDSATWSVSRTRAHSTRYNTWCHWDSGPREYQDAESALNHLRTSHTSLDEIIKGIEYVRYAAPELHSRVQKYMGINLDGKLGDKNQLRKEIIDIAKKMYMDNFKGGAEVDRFRWYMVFLSALIGLGAGALLGGFVEFTGNKTVFNSNFEMPTFREPKRKTFQAITPKKSSNWDDYTAPNWIDYDKPKEEPKQSEPVKVEPVKPRSDYPEEVRPRSDYPEQVVMSPKKVTPVEERSWMSKVKVPQFKIMKSPTYTKKRYNPEITEEDKKKWEETHKNE